MNECIWVIKPGVNDTFWAYTPCKPGHNYLSRADKVKDIKEYYDGRYCPICHGIIRCNTYLVEED